MTETLHRAQREGLHVALLRQNAVPMRPSQNMAGVTRFTSSQWLSQVKIWNKWKANKECTQSLRCCALKAPECSTNFRTWYEYVRIATFSLQIFAIILRWSAHVTKISIAGTVFLGDTACSIPHQGAPSDIWQQLSSELRNSGKCAKGVPVAGLAALFSSSRQGRCQMSNV